MPSALSVEEQIARFMHGFERRNPGEREFRQVVHEVARDILPFIQDYPAYYALG